jgi:prepilin-type N-terminal cleavage/methylation domain-containing protein
MNRKKQGFTLIELLVVISIIALLLSILMPALSKVKYAARRVICSTHMHDLGVTFELYRADNEGYFPTTFWGTNSFNRRIYVESLVKGGYIEGEETVPGNDEWVPSSDSAQKAYSCPSFRPFIKTMGQYAAGSGWESSTAFVIQEYYPIGYAYNSHLSRYNYWDNGPAVDRTGLASLGKDPSGRTLTLIDSISFSVNNGGSRFYPVYEVPPSQVSSNGIIAGVHSGGFANSLWADMHVEPRRADEYSKRDSGNPSILLGQSVLDHKLTQVNIDQGYLYSEPKGKIACGE